MDIQALPKEEQQAAVDKTLEEFELDKSRFDINGDGKVDLPEALAKTSEMQIDLSDKLHATKELAHAADTSNLREKEISKDLGLFAESSEVVKKPTQESQEATQTAASPSQGMVFN